MSRLYGTIDGAAKNQGTMRGHTHLTTHAAGWRGAIRVDVVADADGTDRYTVTLVPWKGSPGTERELCSGVLDSSVTL